MYFYRVLILHIKRFCVTPSYNLVKVEDPVVLSRDLVVSSKEVKKYKPYLRTNRNMKVNL